MYIVTIQVLEDNFKTTYQDKLLSIEEVLDYINYFQKQDLSILDLKVEKEK